MTAGILWFAWLAPAEIASLPPPQRPLCFELEDARLAQLELVDALLLAQDRVRRKGRKQSRRRGRKTRRAPKPSASSVKPPVSTTEPSAISIPGPDATQTTSAVLDVAQTHYAELELDAAIAFAQAVVEREDATNEQRQEAYLILGKSKAITQDPVEAEPPFRFLLRIDPDFDLPPTTPPKILAVFRKVQVEEKALQQEMKERERQRMIETLKATAEVPSLGVGGEPLELRYWIADPENHVAQSRLQYRRAGDPAYSSLALTLDERGMWAGTLPGEWTSSEEDYRVEYYLVTEDRSGLRLLTEGAPASPLAIDVQAGSFEPDKRFYEETWFWVVAGVGLASIAAGTYLLIDERTSLDGPIIELE